MSASRRHLLLQLLPAYALLVLVLLPVVVGSRSLFMRDAFNSHLPQKASHARSFEQGAVPLVDLARGAGQPALGNPNAVVLYPTNLFYLWADPIWALNAHFWLHLLLAPFAAWFMARAFGLSREASAVSAFAWTLCGYVLSQANLYNTIGGVVLAPALIAAAIQLVRRPSGRSRWWAMSGVRRALGARDPRWRPDDSGPGSGARRLCQPSDGRS